MPQSPRSHQVSATAHGTSARAPLGDAIYNTQDETPDETQDATETADAESGPSLEEMRAAWLAQQRLEQTKHQKASAAPAVAVKAPEPYEMDDLVTLLLPNVIRGVVEGVETKEGRVFYAKNRRDFIGTEQPGPIDEDTGRAGRSLALTLTFTGGVCRDVTYAVARGLKKARAYRSNDAMKVIPNDTPDTAYAKLCGVQPMQPQKQAAMLLASDLDAVLAEFDTEQLKTFSAALARRVREGQSGQSSASGASIASGAAEGILNSQSFQRG